jgi:hypothetical protein
MGALGFAAAYLVAGFAGGDPSRPAQNQAEEEEAEDQYYTVPSLQDGDMTTQRTQQGYVININARTNKGKNHVADAINQAMSRNLSTDVNISLNMKEDQGNIDDRYIQQLLAGAIQ